MADSFQSPGAQASNEQLVRELEQLTARLNEGLAGAAKVADTAAANLKLEAKFVDMQVVSYKELNALIARRVQLEGQAAAAALRTAEATAGTAARGPAVGGASGGGVLLPMGAVGKSSEAGGATKVREMSTAEADLAKNMRMTAAASIEANSGLTKGALSSEAISKFANGTITLRELGGQVQETISKFGGWTLAAGAVYGAFGAISTLKTGAVDASSAVQELSKYIHGLDTGKALQAITGLSQEYNIPISEVGQTTASFAQVYHNLPQTITASQAALTAEKLGGMKPQDATQALTAIAQQSGGPNALPGVMDQLVSAQSYLGGGANLSNMLPGVAMVLGSTRLSGGTNIGQLIGVMGLVSQLTGAGGLQIGQAMAKGSQNLLTPTSQNILRQSGIDPLKGYMPSLLKAMQEAPGMNPQQRGLLGSVFFSGMRGASMTAALSASPQQLQSALGATAAGAHPGIAQKQLAEESQKASEQLKELKTNLSAIGAEMAGSGFSTPFGLVVQYLNDALKLTSQLMAMWNSMPGIVKDAGTAVAVAFGARAVATHFGFGSRGAARMEGVQQAAVQGAVNESLQADLVGALSTRAKAAQAAAKADLAYRDAVASGDSAAAEEAAARLEAAKAATTSAAREYELSAAMAEQYGTGAVAAMPGRVGQAEKRLGGAVGAEASAGLAALAPGSKAAEGEALASEEASMTLRERAAGLAGSFTSLLTPMNMFIGAMVAAPIAIEAFSSGLKASQTWTKQLATTQQGFQQASTAQQFVQGASQYAAAIQPPHLSFWERFSYGFTHPDPSHPFNANVRPSPASEQYDQAQLAESLAPSVTTYQNYAQKHMNSPSGRRKLQDLFNRLTLTAEQDDPNSPTQTLASALVGKSTNPRNAVAPQYERALQDAYTQALRTRGGSVPGMFWNSFGNPQNMSGFMDQLTAASQFGATSYSGQSTGVENIIKGYATSVRKFGNKNPQIVSGEQQKVVGAIDEQVKQFQGLAESAPTLDAALGAYNSGLSHVAQAIGAVRRSDMPQSAKKALIGRIRQEAQGMASGLIQTLQTQAELASSSVLGVGPQADLERAQILLRQDQNALSKAKSTPGVSAQQIAQLQLKVNQDRNAVMQAQLTADEQMSQAMSQLQEAQTADPVAQMSIDISNLNSLLAKIQGQGIKDQYERIVLQARISSDRLQQIADQISQNQAQTQAWLAQSDIGQNSLTQANNAVTAATSELNFILSKGNKASPAQVSQAYQNYYQSLAAAFQAKLQEGQAMIQAQSEAAQGNTFDPAQLARIALSYDRKLLAYMKANSAAYNPSAILSQQAKVAQDYKALREAEWQKQDATIQYLAGTYQITGAQEITRLTKLLAAMKKAHASYADIQRVAKERYDLEYNSSGGIDLNVGQMHMPSSYEVRSAILGAHQARRRKTAAGIVADVNTEVKNTFIISKDVELKKIAKALNDALGTSVNGLAQAAGLV